jgi:hypothetical protein
VIKTGPDSYFGWDDGIKSHQKWRERLRDIYNAHIATAWGGLISAQPRVSLKDVPGYKGQSWSLNIPKIGQKIFNAKTDQMP